MKKIIKLPFKILFYILLLAILITAAFFVVKTPNHDRDWELGQEKLTNFVFSEDDKTKVKINNIRDFDWDAGETDNWIEKEVDVKNITGLDVGVSHFSAKDGIGHVFLIFNFGDGDNIGMSIESRRNDGEGFSILGGLKLDYELMYIFASKNDLLSLRKKRNEKIYLYEIDTSTEKAQKLFIALADRQNGIYEKPEFYHLFLKNCTNLIVKELKEISDKDFPFFEATFLPGKAGEVLFDMGLIKTENDNFADVQEEFLVRFDG